MEKYSLKWNDFQNNISVSFNKLRNKSEFYDVTLVSDDQKQVSAHKVVLSSCSTFFNNILEKNKHSHPMLCLYGISSVQLEIVLDYIYFGEVKIYSENINKFLDIAEKLELDGLKGLKENNQEYLTSPNHEDNTTSNPKVKERTSDEPMKLKTDKLIPNRYDKRKVFPGKFSNNDEIDNYSNLKLDELIGSKNKDTDGESVSNKVYEDSIYPLEENTKTENLYTVDQSTTKIKQSKKQDKIMVNPGKFSSIEELDNYIKQQIITLNDGKQCAICFFSTRQACHLREHIEGHLEGLTFQCVNCNCPYPSRPTLRWHMRKCGKK